MNSSWVTSRSADAAPSGLARSTSYLKRAEAAGVVGHCRKAGMKRLESTLFPQSGKAVETSPARPLPDFATIRSEHWLTKSRYQYRPPPLQQIHRFPIPYSAASPYLIVRRDGLLCTSHPPPKA